MNQPYLFCLCVLCNLKNEFFYWIDFILFLFLGLFEGPSHWVFGVSSWNTFQKHRVLCQTNYVRKTVTIEVKVSPVLTDQSSAFVGLERWVNFTQVSKFYSIIIRWQMFLKSSSFTEINAKIFTSSSPSFPL